MGIGASLSTVGPTPRCFTGCMWKFLNQAEGAGVKRSRKDRSSMLSYSDRVSPCCLTRILTAISYGAHISVFRRALWVRNDLQLALVLSQHNRKNMTRCTHAGCTALSCVCDGSQDRACVLPPAKQFDHVQTFFNRRCRACSAWWSWKPVSPRAILASAQHRHEAGGAVKRPLP